MNILMLSESDYPLDVRVKQEADLLRRNGYNVSTVAIKGRGQRFHEVIGGVNVYRVPKIELFKQSKQTTSLRQGRPVLGRLLLIIKALLGYGFEYLYFTVACAVLSIWISIRHGFDVIHTHNPPDTLFTVALLHKVFGKKFVYDHHDLSPDLFNEKYKAGGKVIYLLLLLLERWSCRWADIVIATNDSYKQIEIQRCGIAPDKIFVVRNGPDLNKVRRTAPGPGLRERNETLVCYLGAINNQDGLDYLVEAFAHVVNRHQRHDVKLLIVGGGDYLGQVRRLARERDIEPYTIFTGYINDREVVNQYLSAADIFVDSAPYSFLNDNSTFIKHMEYMVYERPVVSFALKESIRSLGPAGIFVQPNDTRAFARVLVDLIDDPEKRETVGKHGRERLMVLSWDRVSLSLLRAYEALG